MRNKIIVKKMLSYCNSIIERSKGVRESFSQLTPDMDIFKAFAFDLLQLGELAGKVDDEFRKRHPNIPWFDIKGVRNRMAHGYEGVNLNIFRDIVLEHIPLLHEQLSSISEYGSQYPEVADIS